MTVRGIEAIKLYIPPTKAGEIVENIREETGVVKELDESAAAMTSVERYRQEWLQLLKTLDIDPECIRDAAFSGDLKVSKFRSIHWALLLRVLNADHASWCIQRAQQRTRYEKLTVDFVRNPHEIDVPDDNPLSQSTKSVWNQYFSDQELIGVIRQDVVRTFPGVDFFRKPLVQNAMANILFYYAREHPYMCYRQGMHEILAPIIFVLYGDHQSLLHYKEIAKTDINHTLLDVLNPQYLEADAYSIFSRLMSSVESYYRVSNLAPSAAGYIAAEVDISDNNVQYEVEVISQLNLIRDKILAKEDLHLHNYLLKMDIPLHIFGIRWLRLLFGREFALLDLLILWDAVFADSDRFDLPKYILVAMLVQIRDKLLLSDYTSALTYLMRYPPNVDVSLVLRHALHMLYPKSFERPQNAFAYVSFTQQMGASGQQTLTTTKPKNSQPAGTTAISKFDRTPAQPQQRSAPPHSDASVIDKQIQFLQTRNAADAAAMAKLKAAPQANRVAMDGYLENSPELLRLELNNAQAVIKIARKKLQTYIDTVRKHVAKQAANNEELDKSLDGIEELCSFLDVKFMFPLHGRTAPIDQAHEANEQQQRHMEEAEMKRATSPTDIGEQSVQEPLGNGNRIIYEKPESALMYNSARIIGNQRNIEMMQIASDEKPWASMLNGLPTADPLAPNTSTE